MNFKLSVLSSLAVLSTLTFGTLMVPQQALAGCGWLDITCKNSGLRQLGRNLDPTNTTVTEIFIVNETPNTVSYMLNNYENQLKPGDVLRLHAQRRDGFHISFDRSFSDGYQEGSYSLPEKQVYVFRPVQNGIDLFQDPTSRFRY
jgi:hypothetical protein